MKNGLRKRFAWVVACTMAAGMVPQPLIANVHEVSEMSPVIQLEGNGVGSERTTNDVYDDVVMDKELVVKTTDSAYEIAWQPIVFGESIGTDLSKNTVSVVDNIITMESIGNAGKISSTKDGLNFYHTELDAKQNFEIKVKAQVEVFDNNDQVSFGLMLRDTVGINGQSGDEDIKGSRMLGIGGLKKQMNVFSRTKEKSGYVLEETVDNSFPQGNSYDLVIKKSGDLYEFISNGVSVIKEYTDVLEDKIYVGIYTSRNTKVVYKDLEIELTDGVSDLLVSSTPYKTDYLLNEELDLEGLVVTADGEVIPQDKLIITGFNKSEMGTQRVTVNYGGLKTSFTVQVNPLTCEEVKVDITPAKTTYYLGDEIDLTGMVVSARFNSGEERKLSGEEYIVSEIDMTVAGEHTLNVTYKGQVANNAKDTFTITILKDELKGLKIAKNPIKTIYYLGEQLDLKGLAVKAIYGDAEVLLGENEYEVLGEDIFDTTMPGIQVIIIKHKDQFIELPLTVQAKKVVGIEVTELPKTTYTVGENFTSYGMKISKVYDNGDKENIGEDGYVIEASAFNGNKHGVYPIMITPVDTKLKPISFEVSVREPISYEWQSIAFGQSTSKDKNFVEVENAGTPDEKVVLTALQGGGKVTNSFQDGITFYYTELDNASDNFELSADISVKVYGDTALNNQEAFGIMARDAIGVDGDSSVFYSNMAMIGGYRGKTEMVMRSGVTASDASGAANGWQKEELFNEVRPAEGNTYPVQDYKLTLKKTNTGYTGQLNGGKEILFYEPEAMGIQNDKVYVGFIAARHATIEVSNIEFNVTDAKTDTPKVEAPEEPTTPAFNITSLTASATKDYDLKFQSNVAGTATIKQGEKIIARDVEVKGGEVFVQKAVLEESTTTPFTITFTPDTAENLTSYERMVKTISVTMKTYGAEGEAIYVSPNGVATGEGSLSKPLNISTAIDFVRPGQTVYLLEGTYELDSAIGIKPGNNGTSEAKKVLAAAPGAKVTIDAGKKVSGFTLDGDYWHIFGIDFKGATSTGFRVGGNYNTVELCNVYENGDTGLQISRYGNGGYDTWPAYNLILNCTSYDNIDPSENNADGFAAKLTCGPGNIFKGCIAHNNIDDAWDLFAKGSTGPIGAVTLEDCIAYNNGTLTNGYVGKGDKNGFKLGGEGIAVPHIIRNSIAFNNGATGFSSNSNPAVISENCVSYDNEGANFDWRVYTDVIPQFKATGNISYRSSKGPKDVYPTSLKSKDNYYYDGEKSVNSEGVVLSDKNFASLEVPEGYKRDDKGNIIFGEFLKFIKPSTPEDNGSGDNSSDDDSSSGSSSTKPVEKPIIKPEEKPNDKVEVMSQKIVISLGINKVTKNNKEIKLAVKPYIEKGRTMAGVRDMSTLLGIATEDMVWNNKDKSVTIKGKDIVLQVGKTYALVKEQKVDLGVEVKLVNDRVVLPIAQIGRILGIEVDFNKETKEVIISYK